MEYISTKEASAKWGISTTRITILANEGRIPGAKRLGKSWLIPVSATKPPILKANHSGAAKKKTNSFSFPLYHFRPDWNAINEAQLTEQQQKLFLAETAVLECRFSDAYPVLEAILDSPDDIITEIGCLWNAGVCYFSLNKPKDFARIFLRLQILFDKDFPHRDDLLIILEVLNTYIQTVDSAANNFSCNLDIHEQCLPLTCTQIGYMQLSKEIMKPGLADTTLMELILRLLKNSGVVAAVQIFHCHMLSIYYIRQNLEEAEKHAKAIVQIAYENNIYFPMVSYHSFLAPVLSPIIAQYPEAFVNHCHEIIAQYDKNYSTFLSTISESEGFAKVSPEDHPYILGVMTGLTNASIAEKMGVSQQTVKRRISKVCEKLGVETRKELLEYLHTYM